MKKNPSELRVRLPEGANAALDRQTLAKWTIFGIVLLIAFAIRVYKIDSPLWLDEIYGYRLAKLGFEAIIQSSWTDAHPPLYCLLQLIISGFGYIQTEIGWRWPSSLNGAGCSDCVFRVFLLSAC